MASGETSVYLCAFACSLVPLHAGHSGRSLGQPTSSGVLHSAFPSAATLSSANTSAAGASAPTTDGLVSAGSGWRGDVQVLEGSPDVVRLTPTVLGKGAHGRVVVGEYRGARVAVKVLVAPGLLEGHQPANPGAVAVATAAAAEYGQSDPAATLPAGPQQQPEDEVSTSPPAAMLLAQPAVRRPSHQQAGAPGGSDGGGGGGGDSASSSAPLGVHPSPAGSDGRDDNCDRDRDGNSGNEAQGEQDGGQAEACNSGSTTGGAADEGEDGAVPEPPPAFIAMLRASQLGSGIIARRKRSTRSSIDWLSGPGTAAECALLNAVPPGMDRDMDPDRAAQEEVALCVTDLTHIAHTLESEAITSDQHALRPHVEKDRAASTEDAAAKAAAAEAAAAGDKAAHALAQEVEVLARCQHPNVVRLLAVCLTPPRVCLVMELMGTSLDKMLYGGAGGGRGASNGAGGASRRPLLPLRSVLHIALDVAHGLAYLHPTIVHRDLKPANILVNNPWGDRPVAKLSVSW